MALLKDIYIATRTRNVEDAGTTNAPKLLVSRGSQDLLLVPLEGDIDGLGRGRAAVFRIDVSDQELDSANLVLRLLASGDDAWAPEHILVWGVGADTLEINGIAPLGALIDIALPGSARSAGIWLSTDSSEGVSEILVSPVAPPLPTPPGQKLPPLGSRAGRIIVIVATDQYPSMIDPGPGPGGNRDDVGTNGPVTLQAGRPGGPLFVSYQLPKTPQGDLARGNANFYLTLVAGAFGYDDIGSQGVYTLTINSQDWWIPDYFAVFGIDGYAGQPNTLIPFTQDTDFSATFGDHHILSTDPAQGWHSVLLRNASPIS
ncbi:hypothetical protein [Mycobacterium sp.]|jgi:hypothetical protein|uniref:hypothetical protein n=1 Tax=Mycobacterium sp. TaxID=1785 RepID=UPI003C75F4DA